MILCAIATCGAGSAILSGAQEFIPVFCVARSLVFCIMFCWSLFVLFFYCVGCSSSIYGFWLSLWYFQTFLSQSMLEYRYEFCIFVDNFFLISNNRPLKSGIVWKLFFYQHWLLFNANWAFCPAITWQS